MSRRCAILSVYLNTFFSILAEGGLYRLRGAEWSPNRCKEVFGFFFLFYSQKNVKVTLCSLLSADPRIQTIQEWWSFTSFIYCSRNQQSVVMTQKALISNPPPAYLLVFAGNPFYS